MVKVLLLLDFLFKSDDGQPAIKKYSRDAFEIKIRQLTSVRGALFKTHNLAPSLLLNRHLFPFAAHKIPFT